MAKGYPDFYGFSIFPKYGSVMIDDFPSAAVGPGATVAIHEVFGNGRIYGGHLYCTAFADWSDIYVRVFIDGVQMNVNNSVSQMFAQYGHVDVEWPLQLVNYRGDGGHAVFAAEKDYTFTDTYLIEIENTSAGNLWVYSRLHYSLIV